MSTFRFAVIVVGFVGENVNTEYRYRFPNLVQHDVKRYKFNGKSMSVLPQIKIATPGGCNKYFGNRYVIPYSYDNTCSPSAILHRVPDIILSESCPPALWTL